MSCQEKPVSRAVMVFSDPLGAGASLVGLPPLRLSPSSPSSLSSLSGSGLVEVLGGLPGSVSIRS